METSKQQTLPFGEIESMCCRADSPVNRSARRGKEKARKTTATSGPKCSELFDLFDPVGSWGRTLSELLIGRKDWFSNRCVLTWKRKDTRCCRSLYQLVASMPRTDGIGHGSLPTVQTQGLKMCDGDGKTQFYPVGLLPTPSACDIEGGVAMDVQLGNGHYFRENKKGIRWGVKLRDVVESGILPTPTARDFKGARTKEALEKSGRSNKNNLPDQFARTGRTSLLNPRFVAEMMGFPADWTESPFQNGEKNRSKPTAMR